jgi:pyruvate/2-oxoglutarate dehydrogenase complex dihydrolipoamide acyltransferase (E2) component
MGTPINIPKLGWTMEEGTLSKWLIDDGATVAAGDPLYILETDKIENEIAAPASGVLRHGGVEGDVYPVGSEIGAIE